MELLYRYEEMMARTVNWAQIEEGFLDGLDEDEDQLLERAQRYMAEQATARRMTFQMEMPGVPVSSQVGAEPKAHSPITVTELVDKFLDHKAGTTKRSSLKSYESKCRRFDRVVTLLSDGRSPDITELDENLIRKYRDIVVGMPSHLTSQREFDRYVLTREAGETKASIAPLTAKMIFVVVSNFLAWIEGDGYLIKRGLAAILNNFKKPKERDRGRRVAFNDDDLRRLFTSREYRSNGFKRSTEHWLPLIALFTGATLAEIAQLHTEDVMQVDDIWIIDINAKGDKELKNDDGRPRQVPIHSQLVALGFLEFVALRRKQRQAVLFPESYRNSYGAFDVLSKWFARYRDRVGIVTERRARKDLHSFRHTVASRLIGLGLEEGLVNDIIGHASQQRSETRKTYAKSGSFIQVKAQAIEKLEYNLPFDQIGQWRMPD